MNIKRLLLKLAVLICGVATLQSGAAPVNSQLCREFAVLCSTGTGAGKCGTQAPDCQTCFGFNGSVQANSPDCL